jgi:tetratricopeptide (TPR) repeat protein
MNRLKGSILLLAVPFALSFGQAHTSDYPAQRSAEILYAELSALVAQHKYVRAEQMVHQLLASSDDPAATYLQVGKVYFDREAWERSAGFLEKSLKFQGTNDKAHQLLGLDWRELHRPDNAEAELLEAAKENPSNKVNAYLAGHQLLLNGKFDVALPYLYSALDWKPLQSQALQALALAQARLGNYGLSESYYRRAVDSAQTSDEGRYSALLNLSILLLLGHDSKRLEEGLSCAQRAEKLQPDSPEAHFLTGKALFKLGRPGEASPELARAARLNPKDSKTHFLLARIYDQLGQLDRARKEREAVARIQGHPGQAGMATVDSVPVKPANLPGNLHR